MKLPSYIPQLDVLRGVAVLEVMLYHAAGVVPGLPLQRAFNAGYTGVDLFFVLSGFLITGILIKTRDSDCYFRNFYARRALRIWPLYYTLLIFTFIVLPVIAPQLRTAIFTRSHPWQAFPFFVQNLMLKREAFDTLRVTWTLAIEEQFYLAWPVIVRFAPRRTLKPLALCAVLGSVAIRWSVTSGLIPPVETYTNTLTRLDGLGLGAFLGLWIPEAESSQVRYAGIAAIVLALPITIAVGWLQPGHWSFYTLVSVCFAGLLCLAINVTLPGNWEFLKYTGKISYALYLFHVPVFEFARTPAVRKYLLLHSAAGNDSVLLVVSFLVCYALASASWCFFESKFQRLKSRFETSPGPRHSFRRRDSVRSLAPLPVKNTGDE
jgi:peptidoglycan/LPS O-acetylase OafA/YrhL